VGSGRGGKLAAYIFPSLNFISNCIESRGQPVFLPRLVLGIALTLFLALLNYRGIRLSANFQNWATTFVLLLFVALLGISAVYGGSRQFSSRVSRGAMDFDRADTADRPLFHDWIRIGAQSGGGSPLGISFDGILSRDRHGSFCRCSFYVLAIAAVAYVAPWQRFAWQALRHRYRIRQALGARWPVRLILVMAMFGLFQCFNGNFVASSRLLFAYGRRGTIPPRFGEVHAKFLTPSVAVLGITAGRWRAFC